MSTVAVVIPVRNMADTLERAVLSAAGADEIHVVDDASTDNIGEVMARLPVKVTYWRWPMKTRNHMAALRTVYHASACRQIIGMGADDVLKPQLVSAVRSNAEAAVILSDYDVVDPEGNKINHVPQDARELRHLTPNEMRKRLQSPRIASETGIGSSLRADVADWLWRHNWEAIGPHMDSIGYASAAATFGCLLLPFTGAAYTDGRSSYGRSSLATQEQEVQWGRLAFQFLERAGIDDATADALLRKRCGVKVTR